MDPRSKKITVEDIPNLSDHGLREALKNYEQAPGPITESTRNIYRKKLASLLQDQNMNDDDDTSDEDFIVEEEEENQETDDDGSEELSEVEEEEKQELLKDLERDIVAAQEQRKSSCSSSWSSSFGMLVGSTGVFVLSLITLYAFAEKLPIYKTVLLSSIVTMIYGVIKIFGYFRKRTHRQAEEVCNLVTNALELLQSPENPTGMMPVLHIRDTLLTPAERNSKKTIQLWNQCVKFIEHHESRVKVEIVNVEGEDFKAWKWIGSRK